jgi:Dolichyl-phosphate-mannose-protein mannosyltransferase
MSVRLSVASSIACVAAILVAIVGTYSRLSQTIDEPTHIAAGLEWLQEGRVTLRTENPPVARVIVALGPYFSGIRLPSLPRQRRNAIAGSRFLYQGPGYVTTLSRARLGTLLFLVLSAVMVWLWAGGTHQPPAAALAVAMFVTIPSIVAHAGLATTDIAFIAVCLVAGLAIQRWIERPTWPRAVGVGIAVGVSVATKFSTFVFLPPIALALVVTGWYALHRTADSSIRWARAMCQSGVLTLIAVCVVWASYRFAVGRLSDMPQQFGAYGHYPRTGLAARMKESRFRRPDSGMACCSCTHTSGGGRWRTCSARRAGSGSGTSTRSRSR